MLRCVRWCYKCLKNSSSTMSIKNKKKCKKICKQRHSSSHNIHSSFLFFYFNKNVCASARIQAVFALLGMKTWVAAAEWNLVLILSEFLWLPKLHSSCLWTCLTALYRPIVVNDQAIFLLLSSYIKILTLQSTAAFSKLSNRCGRGKTSLKK